MKKWFRPTGMTPSLFGVLQIGTLCLFVWALFQGFAWYWWGVAILAYSYYYGVGMTAGYHRYYSHQSFKAGKVSRWLMALGGVLGGQSSALIWVPTHIDHHRDPDGPHDPHSPRHHGWKMLLATYYPKPTFSQWRLKRYVRKYPELAFTHKYHNIILLTWVITLLLIDWKLWLFAWAIPYCWTLFASLWLITGAHRLGYQSYDVGDDSVNNPFIALLTFGEGWHNNHHKKGGKANFGHKWWEIDPGYWVVCLLRKR